METDGNHHVYEFGEFRVIASKRLLTRVDGTPIPLTAKVFDTLLYFLDHPGSMVSKDEIMASVWNATVVEENNLNKNISKLRKIFGESLGENRFIATVAGKGYQFVADVRKRRDIPIEPDPLPQPVANVHTGRSNRWLVASFAALCAVVLGSALYFTLVRPARSDTVLRSLAVVPFKPLVPEHRNESLEFGMADALISRLSGKGEITVRPLSSVRRFAAIDSEAVAAGNALHVDAVLDGTIQTWGDRIRVSATLVRTADGLSLWQGQFEESFDDIFSVQDTIAARVAAALHATLADRSGRKTEDLKAYRLYTLGRFHTLKLNPVDINRGLEYFQQAIDLDPQYALAHAGLADGYRTLALVGGSNEHFAKAKSAALAAIKADEHLADGHTILGFVLFWSDWDWAGAEREIRLALNYDPNSADALFALSHVLSNTGRHDEAIPLARRASELDPLNMRTVGIEAIFLINAGKPNDALEVNSRTRELDPKFWGTYVADSMAYLELGMLDNALGAAKRAREISADNAIAISLEGLILARKGQGDEARTLLNENPMNPANPTYRICPTALLHHALGDSVRALELLERGFERRDPCMTFLKVDRKWDGLREDPKFAGLIRRMNFPTTNAL